MSATLESIIDSVSAFCNFKIQEELYRSDCLIREELAKYRRAVATAKASVQHAATVELARCKTKLVLLQNRIASLSDIHKELFAPLLRELDAKIVQLREERKKLQ